MNSGNKTFVSVQAIVRAPVDRVWKRWTSPEDIVNWNHALDEWCTPRAENDLRPGGNFLYRMEARDGSTGFDFRGTYDEVKTHSLIEYTLGDGRKVSIVFSDLGDKTSIVESFETESVHPVEMQRQGWQAILDNFKKYTESAKA